MLSLQSMVIAVWREIENRKLDFLWALLSLGMVVFTWLYAVRAPYAPIWLYVLLDLQCAVIFAVRRPAQHSTARPLEVSVTLLSLNYLFAFDPVPMTSPSLAAVGGYISAAGAIMALVSIQCLGRSFAILPSLRQIRTSGMYRVVRHPIYLSYGVMALGIVLRHPTLYNAVVALAGVSLMICRIKFEERLLEQDHQYRDYMAVIRYRLIPGVY